MCPVCCLKHMIQLRQEERAEAHEPVFTDSRGRVVDKRHMVAAWRALGGDEEVTGHSARRSGAKMLCRCGWELWKIQFHGRWASDAIKGYTEEVFAEMPSLWKLPRKRAGPDTQLDLQTLVHEVMSLRQQGRETAEAVKQLSARTGAPRIDMKALVEEVSTTLDGAAKFVVSTSGDGVVHRLKTDIKVSTDQWRTRCGWTPASKGRFQLRWAPPSEACKCQKCFAQDEGAPRSAEKDGECDSE